MNKTVNGALCAGVLFLSLAASVDAVPIAEQSLIHVRQLESTLNGNAEILDNFTTTDSSVSHTLDTTSGFDSTIQGRASLITGETGTSAITSTIDPNIRAASSVVTLFDTLTFTPDTSLPILPAATPITYGLGFDGSLANTNAFGASTASAIVTLYDITGLTTWLTQTVLDPAYPTDIFVSSNAPIVSTLGINLFVGAQSIIDNSPALSDFDQLIGNTDGTVFDFDLNKTETFLADPSKTYGISIQTSSVASGLDSFSDFFNTSAFNFTNLNGATFASGSGAFLTAAVPEPSVLALLGIGMIGLMAQRRSRS